MAEYKSAILYNQIDSCMDDHEHPAVECDFNTIIIYMMCGFTFYKEWYSFMSIIVHIVVTFYNV
jgi:hypothetical protein